MTTEQTVEKQKQISLKCSTQVWLELNRRRTSPSESMNDVLQRLLELTR